MESPCLLLASGGLGGAGQDGRGKDEGAYCTASCLVVADCGPRYAIAFAGPPEDVRAKSCCRLPGSVFFTLPELVEPAVRESERGSSCRGNDTPQAGQVALHYGPDAHRLTWKYSWISTSLMPAISLQGTSG